MVGRRGKTGEEPSRYGAKYRRVLRDSQPEKFVSAPLQEASSRCSQGRNFSLREPLYAIASGRLGLEGAALSPVGWAKRSVPTVSSRSERWWARRFAPFLTRSQADIFLPADHRMPLHQMSARDASDTDFVIGEIPRHEHERRDRPAAKLRPWADAFPYVISLCEWRAVLGQSRRAALQPHGALLSAQHWQSRLEADQPRHFGLDDPVAEDEERGARGMHYTGVPNILKVLNPLFLDDLRVRLGEA